MLKSDSDKTGQGGSQSSDQSAVSPDDDKIKDDQSISELTELDDSQSPDAMSDISSTPSLSDLHSNNMESDHSTSSLSDLFTNSINSLSWEIPRVSWCKVMTSATVLYCKFVLWIYITQSNFRRPKKKKMKFVTYLRNQIEFGWTTNTCHWSFKKNSKLLKTVFIDTLERRLLNYENQKRIALSDVQQHLETIEISSIQTNNMLLICAE